MSRDGVTLVVGVRTAVDGLRKSQNSASSNLPNRDNLFISVTILCEAQPAASDIQVSATPPRDTAAGFLIRPSRVAECLQHRASGICPAHCIRTVRSTHLCPLRCTSVITWCAPKYLPSGDLVSEYKLAGSPFVLYEERGQMQVKTRESNRRCQRL